MRLLLVWSEHTAGLTAPRVARYRELESRLAALTEAQVDTAPYESLARIEADAVVLSGSGDPWQAHPAGALDRFQHLLAGYEGPALGICAGMQLQARAAGGDVGTAARPVRGFRRVDVLDASDLLFGLAPGFAAFQHHTDEVTTLPSGFRVLATSGSCAVEAMAADDRPWWGTQFHPERWSGAHPAGRAILERFLRLAGLRGA